MDFNNKKLIEYLNRVKVVPKWDRIPAISNKELKEIFDASPWENPLSDSYGCIKHSLFDCKKCSEVNIFS